MFAGDWTIKVLGWLVAWEEGMAIEDKAASFASGIVRAQKKVEERNFLSRKNLLDYDEVNDGLPKPHHLFYGMRQRVLEGRDVDKVIWKMIGDAIEGTPSTNTSPSDYVAATISANGPGPTLRSPSTPHDLQAACGRSSDLEE